jgi:CheY-like chemotaxis protein
MNQFLDYGTINGDDFVPAVNQRIGGNGGRERCAARSRWRLNMDLLMPEMDGVEATRRIMAQNPCTILLVTVSVEANSWRVFEAMGHGALDAVDTPILGAGH